MKKNVLSFLVTAEACLMMSFIGMELFNTFKKLKSIFKKIINDENFLLIHCLKLLKIPSLAIKLFHSIIFFSRICLNISFHFLFFFFDERYSFHFEPHCVALTSIYFPFFSLIVFLFSKGSEIEK